MSPMEDSLLSTYELIVQTTGTAFLLLGLLAVMVSVPWVGAAVEDWFHGPSDEDDEDGDHA